MNAPLATGDGWVQLLDQLERDVVELDTALVQGNDVPVQAWVPPRDLGPLPDELQTRARRLALRLTQLQSRTRDRLGELTDELSDVEQRRRAGAAYAR